MSSQDSIKRKGSGETSPGDYKRHVEILKGLKKWLHNNQNKDQKELFRACLINSKKIEENSLWKAKIVAIENKFTDAFIADEIRPYKYGAGGNPHTAKQLEWDTFWGHEEQSKIGVAHPDDYKS